MLARKPPAGDSPEPGNRSRDVRPAVRLVIGSCEEDGRMEIGKIVEEGSPFSLKSTGNHRKFYTDGRAAVILPRGGFIISGEADI